MRHALASEHREFFSRHRFIEFDDLVPDAPLALREIDTILSSRLKKMADSRSPAELFKVGRDIWRKYPKLTADRSISELAASLFKAPVIRLGYDQVLKTTAETGSPITQPFSLQRCSCLQPILGGLLLRLTADFDPPAMTPKNVGGGIFFDPALPLPWPSLFQNRHQTFLLIVYTPERSLYVLNPDDPHTHALKKEGYGFGDVLKNRILFK